MTNHAKRSNKVLDMGEHFRILHTEASVSRGARMSVSGPLTELTCCPLNDDIVTAGNFTKERLVREIYRKALVCE